MSLKQNNTQQITGQTALLGGIAISFVFTAIIWLGAQNLDFVLGPDLGPRWYYWQLAEQTTWGRITAWGFYAVHQIAFWGIIYYAQKNYKKYAVGLNPINKVALAANAFFIVLHFIQTQIWYDGLAQDVSSISSQNSVILLLVWVLLLENKRRGLFLGKKVPFGQRINRIAREYHGYFFAWGIVYTFWFHPMEGTFGHLLGFFYMFLLILQGSLMYTRVHTNRWWTFSLEVLVVLHAASIAMTQSPEALRMFGFGFLFLLVMTQIYGIDIPKWSRIAITVAFFAAIIVVYSQAGWVNMNEVIRIPAIEYLAAIALGLIMGGIDWFIRRIKPPQLPTSTDSAAPVK